MAMKRRLIVLCCLPPSRGACQAEWLKVKYLAEFPNVPDGMTGKTFSHVCGSGIGPLERFLMKRNLMGPCWLDIKGATSSRKSVSWCKIQADCVDPKTITRTKNEPAAPPLVVLSLRMQTMLNKKSHKNEIFLISGVVHNKIECDGPTPDEEDGFSQFSAIRKLGDKPFPFDFRQRCFADRRNATELCSSERALLGFVMAKIHKIDADVIVGHDILGFDLDVLLHRIKENNIPNWSRIGRLRRTEMPKLQGGAGGRASFAEKAVASGRLLIDLKISAREFLRLTTYEMNELVQTQLPEVPLRGHDLDAETIPGLYDQSEDLLSLRNFVERDAWFIMKLMLKLLVLPLSKQITNITGGLLARTFAGGRSERNEFLLCHEFHKRKYIVPDKKRWQPKQQSDEGDGKKKNEPRRKKAGYGGGLVLEPKKGFYDTFILLLDFNSLYPSIIQEYNLCFTTVDRKLLGDTEDIVDGAEAIADVPDSALERGILPKVIRNLIMKRRAVKDLIKKETNAAKLTDYDIRQKALKLTANSMYGCLGFTASRFYAKPIAALITSKGREILQKTVDLAQDVLNLDVIYGDTDSIMINTRCQDLEQTKKIGNQVKKEVNALYTELEIEIDGVFKTMLLLKKKKYAALTISEKHGKVTIGKELKGLDIVRRDWCKLSHDVGNFVLNKILTMESRENLVEECHDHLRSVAEDVKEGKIPVAKYVINKGLTKDPSKYADKKHQPHVQVALRMIAAGKSVKALDTIPYIVCKDGTNNPPTQRAYHPADLKKAALALEIDFEYYLKNQVHPVVTRLCDPIAGTDGAQIAACLGLEASEFHAIAHNFENENEVGMGMMSQMSDAERFKGAEGFDVRCQKCGVEKKFPGVFIVGEGTSDVRCGLLCQSASCSAKLPIHVIMNKLTLAVRQSIDKYYLSELKCDDQTCSELPTRQLSVTGMECLDPYCRGSMRPVYSDKTLYTQLSYFQSLFDIEHATKQLPTEEMRDMAPHLVAGHQESFGKIFDHVDKFLQKSARKHVDLGALFSALGLGLAGSK